MEIANLKTIIGRFSDFSKMPKPELERIDARDVVERVRVALRKRGRGQSEAKIQFRDAICSSQPMPLDGRSRAAASRAFEPGAERDGRHARGRHADPFCACRIGDKIEIRVADTGEGLTPEECERLFTPYYTTKQHGTGLGLAIVQSVVADHAGTIAVESRAGRRRGFIITLPKA